MSTPLLYCTTEYMCLNYGRSSDVPDLPWHSITIRGFQTITLIVKESPFHQRDFAIIKDFSDKLGFDVAYYPGIDPTKLNRYNVLPQEVYYEAFTSILSPSEREVFLVDYTYDISPPTDDRPFFFHFFKWSQVPYIWYGLGKTWQPFGGAGYLIIIALLLSAVLASAFWVIFVSSGEAILNPSSLTVKTSLL